MVFHVGNNFCVPLLISFPYLIITSFTIWDKKKLFKGFVSFILICFKIDHSDHLICLRNDVLLGLKFSKNNTLYSTS